jgi:hypothetical protein
MNRNVARPDRIFTYGSCKTKVHLISLSEAIQFEAICKRQPECHTESAAKIKSNERHFSFISSERGKVYFTMLPVTRSIAYNDRIKIHNELERICEEVVAV